MISFFARPTPLTAVAIAARGPHVRTLFAKLRALSDEQLARFSGVRANDAAIILGPADALPWFDGAQYLGAHGGLLLPTWAEPSVHSALLERALRQSVPPGPIAVLLDTLDAAPLVVPLAAARPLSRERLT